MKWLESITIFLLFFYLYSGHFSQMVWRDTTALGVGLALSNSKRNVYVVTFFSPKGNWLGEFATQVLPPL